MKGGRDADDGVLVIGVLTVCALWLLREARRERAWVRRGQTEVERFLKAEAEGWR